jgi:hypothetical protein
MIPAAGTGPQSNPRSAKSHPLVPKVIELPTDLGCAEKLLVAVSIPGRQHVAPSKGQQGQSVKSSQEAGGTK